MLRRSGPAGAAGAKIGIPFPLVAALLLGVAFSVGSAATVASILRLRSIEQETFLVWNQWQAIDSLSNDVLLKRVSYADGGAIVLVEEWERRTLNFSLALAHLNDKRRLAVLGPEVVAAAAGAAELWARVQGSVLAAQKDIRTMMRSGLAYRVMVNGFLSTYYQLRMQGLLPEADIIEIREAIADLEMLDAATDEIGGVLRSMVDRVAAATEAEVARITAFAPLAAFGIAALAASGWWYFRRLKRAERSRRRERERLVRAYLRDLFDPAAAPSTAAEAAAEAALEELGEGLPFRPNLILCALRFDGAPTSAGGDDALLLAGWAEAQPGPAKLAFPDGDGGVIVLAAADGEDGGAAIADAARAMAAGIGRSLSSARTLPFDGRADRRGAFRRLKALFAFRYVRGPAAALAESETGPAASGGYVFPPRAEELVEKRLMEGKVEECRGYVESVIAEAARFDPTSARGAVARIAAALLSSAERLERSLDADGPAASADVLARIVAADTAAAAAERIREFCAELERAIEGHRGGRAEALAARVDAFIDANLADPNLCLDLIADRLALSASHLGRTFRRTAGESVADRIADRRMAAAGRLLAETDLTVEAIAARLGIGNTGGLYRSFKTRYGVTPAEYREKARWDGLGAGGGKPVG